MPHLNDLIDQFEDRPQTVIAITDEDSDVARAFTERREMRSWVAIGDGGATSSAYGAWALPHSVILDAEGRIAAVTHPVRITPALIERVLAGKSAFGDDDAKNMQFMALGEGNDQRAPLFQAEIRESTLDNGDMMWSSYSLSISGGFHSDTWSASRAASQPIRIVDEDRLLDHESDYTVQIVMPEDSPMTIYDMLPIMIESSFGIRGEVVSRPTSVAILGLSSQREHLLETTPDNPQRGGLLVRPTKLEASEVHLQTLAQHLENSLNIPVIDETGPDSRAALVFPRLPRYHQESPGQPGTRTGQ